MNFDELIRLAASSVIDDAKIRELETQLKEAEEQFEREAKPIDNNFLSRVYSL